jgi:hypothetical protein
VQQATKLLIAHLLTLMALSRYIHQMTQAASEPIEIG